MTKLTALLMDRGSASPVILALAVSMLLSFALTPLVKRLAYKIGAVDVPKDKRRMRTTELVGGEGGEDDYHDTADLDGEELD